MGKAHHFHRSSNTRDKQSILFRLIRFNPQVPDLYIRQIREMKVLTLFEEISSLRLYKNSTLVFSLGYDSIYSIYLGQGKKPDSCSDFFFFFLQRNNCHQMRHGLCAVSVGRAKLPG